MEPYAGFEYALSCYIRVIIIAFAGQLIGLAICDVMMVRKRKWNALIAWLVVKTGFLLFQYCWVDFIAPGSDMGQVFVAVSNFWSAIITSLMFYYTYEGELLKVVIGLSLSEIMMSIIVSPCIILVNLLESRANFVDFEGPFQPMDLMIFVFAAGMYFLVAKVAGVLLRKFRHFKVRYRKPLWCFFFCYLGLSQMPTSFGIKNNYYHGMFMYFGHLLGGIIVIVTVYFIYQKYQNTTRMTNEYLQLQMHLMEDHYMATLRQIRQMENSRSLVDQQMERLTIMAENQTKRREKLAVYLRDLQLEYDQLQAGMYCNDWMVDAVLYCQIETAKRQGIDVDCFLQGYDRGNIREEELAGLVYQLFAWGIQLPEYKRKAVEESFQDKKKIKFYMGAVKNQLIIQFVGKSKMKNRYFLNEIQRLVKVYNGIMTVKNGFSVEIVLERNRKGE